MSLIPFFYGQFCMDGYSIMTARVQRSGANLILWDADGSRRYAVAAPGGVWYVIGDAPAPASDWIYPFALDYMTEGYPFYGDGDPHRGIDGDPGDGWMVPACGAGTVIVADYGVDNPARGYWVAIDHGVVPGYGQTVSMYFHMYTILVNVNDTVSAGTLLGEIGDTGQSFGVHLHFQVNANGGGLYSGDVDPRTFLDDQGATGKWL